MLLIVVATSYYIIYARRGPRHIVDASHTHTHKFVIAMRIDYGHHIDGGGIILWAVIIQVM